MALKEDIALLAQVALFSDLDEDKLRLVAFGAERRRVLEGQTLYREGTHADCAFVVASGRFDLSRKGHGRTTVPLGSAGPATLLGEIAMISAVDRHMTVIAAEPSEVLRIGRPLFHRMLDEYPGVAALVQARIQANFRSFLADLERVGKSFAS
ncbi:MAG: cyclic nucleotide-binding domain-containing protein [Pararhizobium sp.]